MRNNEKIAVLNSGVLLVPYCKHHVPRYHEWMKDPEIQVATASEPLSLEQEYSMQKSWRQDVDKLTFIICQPIADLINGTKTINAGVQDADKAMIGDVNMFVTTEDDDEGGGLRLIGELELMVAETLHQGQGLGKSALLTFLRYIAEHQDDIVDEFLSTDTHICNDRQLSYVCAKIGEQNHRSISLFESLGFTKTSTKPTYFGEFELRRDPLSLEAVDALLQQHRNHDYREMTYDGDYKF